MTTTQNGVTTVDEIVVTAASTSAQTVVISASPLLGDGDLSIDCEIEETTVDQLTMTEHPVEYGAAITDHAYKMPAKLTIRAGWSNSSPYAGEDEDYAASIYQKLLTMQATRTPIIVLTAKRLYKNMLIESISQTTDETTATALMTTIVLRQILIVQTQASTLPPADSQALASVTASPTAQGQVQPIPSSVAPIAASPATQAGTP